MRNSFKPALLALVVGAACAGPAFAEGDGGDNGMSPRYGDSWATLEARDPAAAPAPAIAAQEESADARAAWSNTRDHLRGTSDRWREKTSNVIHRMTGTSTSDEDRMTGRGAAANSTPPDARTSGQSTMGTTSRDATGTSSGARGTAGASGAGAYGTSGDAVTTGARGTTGAGALPTTPNAGSARTDNPYDGKAPPAVSNGGTTRP